MPKMAGIYQRKGNVFVSAEHKTNIGYWIADCDVAVLDLTDPTSLGAEVMAALVRSKNDVPAPGPYDEVFQPMLTAAGVASWSAFVKGAKYVGVHADSKGIRVTPHRNRGAKDGFTPMHDLARLAEDSEEALGHAIVSAFALAK